MNKFTLAYCSENAITAKEIDQNLSSSGFEFQHISCDDKTELVYLGDQIPDDQMIILLVSDNLLKSTACMYNALPMIQRLSSEGRVISLIVDGRIRKEDGSIQNVPTSFDRVSHVIQYMNFWQDEYLTLRKLKKQIPAEQEASFETKLKIVRNISSEIGEFLRILRSVESYDYQEFKALNYKVFYYKTGNQSKHKEPVVQEPVVAHQEENNSNVAPRAEMEETLPEIELNNIPGMDQLAETDPNIGIVSPANTTTPPESNTVLEESTKDAIVPNELLEKLIAHREEQEINNATNLEEQMNQVVEEIVDEENSDAKEEASTTEEQELSTEEILQSIFEDEEEELEEQPVVEEENNLPEAEESYEDEEQEIETPELVDDSAVITSPGNQKALSDTQESIYEASRYAEAGEVDKAISLLANLVELNPEDTEVRYQYASLIDQYTDDRETVISVLHTLVGQDPKHINANKKLAHFAEERKDYLAAKNLYEKVVEQTDDYPEIYYKLGIITSKHFVGQKEKAASYFKKAIKLDQSNSDCYYRYAVLLNESLSLPQKAVKHFKNCLALQEDHPFAYYDLALIYYKQGKYKKAEKYYLKACENNPELKTQANDLAFANPPKNEKLTKNALDARMEEEQEIELMEEVLPVVESEETIEIEEELIEEEEIELEEEEIAPISSSTKLENIVFITGATSGIGKATSKLFAQHGYNLILTGRRAEKLESLKSNLEEQYKIQVQTLIFDVRDIKAVKEHVERLPNPWKQVDILINNAGLAKGFAPIHEGSLEHWETMIDTNIKGLLYMTRAIAPYMVERKHGHIINVGSTAGKEVYPNGNVYCATKFAVDALTKSMRLDLHKHNIRVSQVSPGHVEETEFALVRFDGDKDRSKIYEDFQPLKSSDVAEVIYFMATRPAHVNIQDVLLMGTQQAGNNHIDRSGRKDK